MTIEYLINQIESGNVTLFLGAGASKDCGLPLGHELFTLLQKKFPLVNSHDDLFEFSNELIFTPPYNRSQLEENIVEILSKFKIEDYHYRLSEKNWRAIFTTNYDGIVETIYSNPNRLKVLQPVVSNHSSVPINDPSKIYYFKIMGTVNGEESARNLVLSRQDFHRAYIKRRSYFKTLRDIVKTGLVLFVGYSFNDNLALDILSEIRDTYGFDKLPYSYALFPYENLSDRQKTIFQNHKIIPINGTLRDILIEEKTNSQPQDSTGFKTWSRMTFLNSKVTIPQDLYKIYKSELTLITDKELTRTGIGIEDFLKGRIEEYEGYNQNWDFKRLAYTAKDEGILDTAVNLIENAAPAASNILVIKGMPGVGKSVICRRLSFDIALMGIAPVLYFDQVKSQIDFRAIESTINRLNEVCLSDREISERLKVVLIFDNASSKIDDILRLHSFLSSRAKRFVLILCDTIGVLNKLKYNPLKRATHRLISENFDEEEVENFMAYLQSNNFIAAYSHHVKRRIQEELQTSVFATYYKYMHPSKVPLELSIKNSYELLAENSKIAYSFVCFFSSHDLPINLELLNRLSYNDFASLKSEIQNGEVSRIIFEYLDNDDDLLFRAHHKLIAKIVLDSYFFDIADKLELLKKVLYEVNPSNSKEKELVLRLLIENYSINTNLYDLSPNQLVDIFESAKINLPYRSIFHHLGLAHLDVNNFDLAEDNFNQALNSETDYSSFRGESEQNIFTSLGKLYLRKAFDPERSGIEQENLELFEKANNCFEKAKHGDIPNSHAYHAQANMYWGLYKSTVNSEEAADHEHLTNALEIINNGKDNLNELDLQLLLELEQKVWHEIGDENKVFHLTQQLIEEYKSPSGYIISAYYRLHKAKSLKNVNEQKYREQLAKASRKIDQGLEKFPSHQNLLHLRGMIHHRLFPNETTNLFKYLSEWYNSDIPNNLFLMFLFARCAFIEERFGLSKKLFDELDNGLAIGHSGRMRPILPIRNKENKESRFLGSIRTLKRTYGTISCSDLPALNYPIKFSKFALQFTPTADQMVEFSISFTYSAAFCTRITNA